MADSRSVSDRLKRHVVWVCAGCDECEPLDGAPPSTFPCSDSPSLNGAEVVLAEEHEAEVDRLRAQVAALLRDERDDGEHEGARLVVTLRPYRADWKAARALVDSRVLDEDQAKENR